MINKIVQITGVLLLFALSQSFSQTKEELFSQLSSRFTKASSISFDFQSEEMKSFIGTIKAKKGNKYIIEASGRIIKCNGKTLWNYSIQDKQVIISDFNESYLEGSSIETIFFKFLNEYEPIDLKREHSSKSSSLLLIMKKKGSSAKDNNEIHIWLEHKTHNPLKIQMVNNNEKSNWLISNLKTDLTLSDSQFKLSIPKEVEIIDLR